jgi:hypothetical protein
MARHLPPISRIVYLLFPSISAGNDPQNHGPVPDKWRPERLCRPAGWSNRRRARYPFEKALDWPENLDCPRKQAIGSAPAKHDGGG